MTNTLPAFRLTFSFFSKKLTNGAAIQAIIQPMTKGMKNTSIRGSSKTVNNTIIAATTRFMTAFRYFFAEVFIPSPL